MTLADIPAPPRITLTAAVFGVLLAVTVQVVAGVAFWASLATRVESVEVTVEPLRKGDLAAVQRDVAWIRQTMDRDREQRR